MISAAETLSQEPVLERRLHLRAYHCWLEKTGDRDFPSRSNFSQNDLGEFAANLAFVIPEMKDFDLTTVSDIGSALVEDAQLSVANVLISKVPHTSLLSRITDHYVEVLANCAPVGYEAEYTDNRNRRIAYRALLLPCSENNKDINCIIGVISWKIISTEQSKNPEDNSTLKPSVDTGHQERKEKQMAANYDEAMQSCMEIEGAVAVALVDLASGMALATAGNPRNLDLDVAAAGNSNVVRAKMNTMVDLGLKDTIEDILITLTSQYHLIRPLTSDSGQGLFLYLALTKKTANLAMARHKLQSLEKNITI